MLTDRVVCVIGHPDDEALGCGATLAKAASAGADVRVVLAVRRTDPRGREHWDEIIEQFAASCAILGAEPVVVDGLLPEEQTETDLKALHALVEDHIDWANLVITHWPGDVHQVHRQVARAVEIATRPFRRRRNVLFMEVPTSTDQSFCGGFAPNLFVQVSDRHMAAKVGAMSVYRTELDPGRRPEDLERLLRQRGVQSGTELAEAFVIARSFA